MSSRNEVKEILCQRNAITHFFQNLKQQLFIKLLSKVVIVESYSEPLRYMLGIFTRDKKDGDKRF